MYAIGTRVYVKSHDCLGVVTEANYIGKPRRASYLVELSNPDQIGHHERIGEWLTGSHDLRAADGCCDGCSRWLPHGSFVGGATGPDGEYPDAMHFCFLCVQEAERMAKHSHDYDSDPWPRPETYAEAAMQ